MKIDMYQQVPESFHGQLLAALDRLPEEENQNSIKHGTKRRSAFRKWLVLAAAAVLALGAVTAAASEIFKWQRQAKERFGVSDEVEDELTMDGVTRQENTTVQAQGAEFRLLQSVRTGRSCYYLCQVNLPEGIAVDEDTVFGKVYAETAEGGAKEELYDCTADFVRDSLETEQILMEIEVFLPEGSDQGEQEVTLHISDLLQTQKSEVTGTLLEGEWEIPLSLPGQTGAVVYEAGLKAALGGHELLIKKVQAEPFELRLYTEQEEAQHAMMFYPVSITGVRNSDGSLTEEAFCMNKFGHVDEDTGEFFYRVTLEQAIDPAKITGVVFNDGEAEIDFVAGTVKTDGAPAEGGSGRAEASPEGNKAGIDVTVSDTELPEDIQALYRRNGHEIVTDGKGLYLHDISCGRMCLVLDLEELDYDRAKGGEIVPFSTDMAYILPYEGSETVYIYCLSAIGGEHSLSAVPAEEILESEHYQSCRQNMLEVRDAVAAFP